MFIARVVGSVVASVKTPSMAGQKLLVVEPLTGDASDPGALKPTGRRFVSVDTVGAGEGDWVLLTQGSSARMTEQTGKLPVDAVIIGIVDQINMAGVTTYRKQPASVPAGAGQRCT